MDTNKSNRNILDLLDNVELELLQSDTEYAKQYLIEEGVDIAEEEEFAILYMKKIQFMAKALSNKKQDHTLLERALERVKKVIAENATQTSEALMVLLQKKTPSIQYRKLENWSDDEIRDVLADVDLVKLMEELDKE
jgi:ribosomal protein S15P/S13E